MYIAHAVSYETADRRTPPPPRSAQTPRTAPHIVLGGIGAKSAARPRPPRPLQQRPSLQRRKQASRRRLQEEAAARHEHGAMWSVIHSTHSASAALALSSVWLAGPTLALKVQGACHTLSATSLSEVALRRTCTESITKKSTLLNLNLHWNPSSYDQDCLCEIS